MSITAAIRSASLIRSVRPVRSSRYLGLSMTCLTMSQPWLLSCERTLGLQPVHWENTGPTGVSWEKEESEARTV